MMSSRLKYNLLLKMTAFALLLPLTSSAQDKNMISLAGGYSLPLGSFASQNFSDSKAGLAGAGAYAQLSYERKITDRYGLRLTGSLNINKTDAQPLIDEYSSLLANPESYSWQKETSTWRLGALLLGPSAYLPLGRAQLEVHAQAGLVYAESPTVTALGTSSAGGPEAEGRVARASTAAFGFGAGASARFRLTDHLRFQVTADAIGANARLKDVPTYRRLGRLVLESTDDPERFVAVINLGAGLVFSF